MTQLRERLQTFRNHLIRTVETTCKGWRTEQAIFRGLIADYDRLFPPDTLGNSEKRIHHLIEKYCHPWPGCPICNSSMSMKDGKYGPFYGCDKYPDCQGARYKKDKKPSITEALRIFLGQAKIDKEAEEKKYKESRFRDMEI